jgi:hypothetical protein
VRMRKDRCLDILEQRVHEHRIHLQR